MTDDMPDASALAGAGGIVVGIAVDHRDSLHKALHECGIADADDALIAAIKVDVVRALAPAATVVLIDHDVGWLALRAAGGPPVGVAVAMPLEAQGYGALYAVERTRLLEHPTPAEAVRAGAAACKLLLPLRPDHAEQARIQLDVAAAAVAACHGAGIPLILEPIVWKAPGEKLSTDRFAQLVIEAAALLAPLVPGLLKLQYPGSSVACGELNAACSGHPWVLLGGGAPLAELERHVRDACAAGASGAIIGRSLFAGALDRDPVIRASHLHDNAIPAFARLAAIARQHGRSLHTHPFTTGTGRLSNR